MCIAASQVGKLSNWKTYLEKCVFRFNVSNVFGDGLPMVSSILFGRCRLLPLLPFFVVASLLRWLQIRRLFTINNETVFIIIAPRIFVLATWKLLRALNWRAFDCDALWFAIVEKYWFLNLFSVFILYFRFVFGFVYLINKIAFALHLTSENILCNV